MGIEDGSILSAMHLFTICVRKIRKLLGAEDNEWVSLKSGLVDFWGRKILVIMCWEFSWVYVVKDLLGALGLWVCEFMLVRFCVYFLCELWVLINVNIIHIVDSEYFSWRVGLVMELANIVILCCFIFLFIWVR